MQEAFPAPAPATTLRKVTGGRHVWIAEADIDYGGDQTQAVIIFELDDQGLIARQTRYYPQRLQARPGAPRLTLTTSADPAPIRRVARRE